MALPCSDGGCYRPGQRGRRPPCHAGLARARSVSRDGDDRLWFHRRAWDDRMARSDGRRQRSDPDCAAGRVRLAAVGAASSHRGRRVGLCRSYPVRAAEAERLGLRDACCPRHRGCNALDRHRSRAGAYRGFRHLGGRDGAGRGPVCSAPGLYQSEFVPVSAIDPAAVRRDGRRRRFDARAGDRRGASWCCCRNCCPTSPNIACSPSAFCSSPCCGSRRPVSWGSSSNSRQNSCRQHPRPEATAMQRRDGCRPWHREQQPVAPRRHRSLDFVRRRPRGAGCLVHRRTRRRDQRHRTQRRREDQRPESALRLLSSEVRHRETGRSRR